MAITSRIPHLAARVHRAARLPSLQSRSLLTSARPLTVPTRSSTLTYTQTQPRIQSLRAFSKYTAERAAVHNESAEAPNAKAYLDSGAILGGRDLVDVKKVLVIGSGGLAIGQAGEFDYSGRWF